MSDESTKSFWHDSHLGVAICDACDAEWACHSAAWGRPNHTSTHHLCGGIVRWYSESPVKPTTDFMRDVKIVVSDSAHYDMFQQTKDNS